MFITPACPDDTSWRCNFGVSFFVYGLDKVFTLSLMSINLFNFFLNFSRKGKACHGLVFEYTLVSKALKALEKNKAKVRKNSQKKGLITICLQPGGA